MTDSEILEWYKNGSSRPAGMSDKDYELNMNKALKLQKNQDLQNNLNNQQVAVSKAQAQSQQSASISNEKLMKYLGQVQLSSGAAKGQTSSDFINANNSYVNTRANINNKAAVEQQNLLDSYYSLKTSNEKEALNNEMSILDKYRQREIEDEQLANNRQDREWKAEDRERLLQENAEDRQRQQEEWELKMEAYRKELENSEADRNMNAAEKDKAEKDASDNYWLNAAATRINAMMSHLADENGNLTQIDKESILNEINEYYKGKFHAEETYDKLMDIYLNAVEYRYYG